LDNLKAHQSGKTFERVLQQIRAVCFGRGSDLLGQRLRGVSVTVDMNAVENYPREFFVITNTVYFVEKLFIM